MIIIIVTCVAKIALFKIIIISDSSSSYLGLFAKMGILKDNVNNDGNATCLFTKKILFDMIWICVLYKCNDFLYTFWFKNLNNVHNGEKNCELFNTEGEITVFEYFINLLNILESYCLKVYKNLISNLCKSNTEQNNGLSSNNTLFELFPIIKCHYNTILISLIRTNESAWKSLPPILRVSDSKIIPENCFMEVLKISILVSGYWNYLMEDVTCPIRKFIYIWIRLLIKLTTVNFHF